ncbi:hypothetical protein ACFLWA_05460 [Chloroflexota bacterium]
MRFVRSVILCSTLLLLIVGCEGTEIAVQSPTPAPTMEATATPQASSTAVPTQTPAPTAEPTAEPTLAPTQTDTPAPTPPATATAIVVDSETLHTLEEVLVPIAHPVELAQRLEGVGEVPATVEPPKAPLEVGAKDTFWVVDYTDESYKVPATLYSVTDHAYFWIDDNAVFEPEDVETLAKAFQRIYATNRRFFGSEWSPGIDGDRHIYVLFARRLGVSIAGYFSSADEMHPAAHEYSNAHEMFVLNIDNVEIADEDTYGTLAHEFQHMIHWNLDRNETSWLNEGFAELAQLLNYFPVGGADREYAREPDLQLNTWSSDQDDNFRHYGASFLFVAYLLDRLGEEATQMLASDPANGLVSIDYVLEQLQVSNPETGEPLTADDLVLDWAITNLVHDDTVADGRFSYERYDSPPRVRQGEIIRKCDAGPKQYDVHQYGADYVRVLCPGNYTLRFEGTVESKVVPSDLHSGSYAFWSNKGDSSDMTLTRSFDFGDQSGPLTMSYWTWYDIESGYDYVYLEASTDGESWEILNTPSGTDRDPSGNSYGWGYTGSTRGSEWIQESVDLSQFAGEQVQIRFEYVTDAAVHGEGMLLDDLEIPEVGYLADFEEDDAGWEADGFVRIQNILPQTFRLALITASEDGTTVEYFPLGANNIAEIPLEIPEEGKSVVLVVMGSTRFTRETAPYTLDFLTD